VGDEPSGVPGDARNVAIHRAAHIAFNRRELYEAVRHLHPDAAFTDHATGLTVKGPAEYVRSLQGWIGTFPDAAIIGPCYIDGGDYTVAKFRGRGTYCGAPSSATAAEQQLDVAFCEVLHHDRDGRIITGELYYDSLGALVRFGLPRVRRPA
jgi:SnoaL-like protein